MSRKASSTLSLDRMSRSVMAILFASSMAVAGSFGCGAETETGVHGDESTTVEAPTVDVDGPKLVVIRDRAVVRDGPSSAAEAVGELRLGARIARAQEPSSNEDCDGGWHAIWPRGFVCVGHDATLDSEHPAGQVMAAGPQLDRALPYRYSRVRRGAAVTYSAVPNPFAQQAAEPKLDRRKPPEDRRLGAGANDVPLDERAMPKGPPVVEPDAEGVGADGYRTRARYFLFPHASVLSSLPGVGFTLQRVDDLPPLMRRVAAVAPRTRVLRHGSMVAFVRSFVKQIGEKERRFGILPDGRFIPTERLDPELGSTWHGIDVSKIGLPLGFALRAGVRRRSLIGGTSSPLQDEYEPKQPIPLTGRYRTVGGLRHYRTRDRWWVRHQDIIMIHKRHRYPDWATGAQKWLDISLANQTLTAYEGRKPIYATLISSGRNRLGDHETGPSTRQGVFELRSKHVSRDVDPREVDNQHSLLEVPWVLEFAEGFAITGCTWWHRFGEARSYHNIALAPVDAHFLFHWSAPELPAGWHGVVIGQDEPNTIVYVHR